MSRKLDDPLTPLDLEGFWLYSMHTMDQCGRLAEHHLVSENTSPNESYVQRVRLRPRGYFLPMYLSGLR